jgi:hypothetical protein
MKISERINVATAPLRGSLVAPCRLDCRDLSHARISRRVYVARVLVQTNLSVLNLPPAQRPSRGDRRWGGRPFLERPKLPAVCFVLRIPCKLGREANVSAAIFV